MRNLAKTALFAAFLVGCPQTGITPRGAYEAATQARDARATKEARALAPQAFAQADAELSASRDAERKEDTTNAELFANRAIAAYARADAMARQARAQAELDAASADASHANEALAKLQVERANVDHEADDLEKKLRIAREAAMPTSSGPADRDREAARLVAAKSLAMQARLLCGAAHLAGAADDAMTAADAAVTAVETRIAASAKEPSKGALIDAAARAREGCLASLSKTRRADAQHADTDELLASVSSAGFAPSRDERGVVVTLRDAFQGSALTKDATQKLSDLGRVANAEHVAVQIVVHDATEPTAHDMDVDRARGEATRKLVAANLAADKSKVELAGARFPVVDPEDAAHRGRNARVEIVLVR